jgi:hypothetical protein
VGSELVNGFPSIRRFRDQAQVRLGRQESSHPLSEQRVIVNRKNPDATEVVTHCFFLHAPIERAVSRASP